jgi:hypothetical protein
MVRIGATGHRLLTEHEKISAGIETALKRIEEFCPQATFTAVSSLAEGADCLIARHVLNRPGALLVVPLPVPVDEFLKDFFSTESKLEFRDLLSKAGEVIELPARPSHEISYKEAGEFVVRNCDLLLAVWDGRSSQGEGGTAQIVELARRIRLPIAWVHAGNRKPGTNEPTSLGDEQGRVEFERLEELKTVS